MAYLFVAPMLTVLGVALAVRWLEPRLAFFPLAGESTTPADYRLPYDAVSIETRDGERLRAWILPQHAPRARIIYFHGNGGNLSMWAPVLGEIARRGYAVAAFDYRGYGASTGRPSERGLYRDVDALVDRVWTERDHAAPLVYWGRSLGVVMAAYAATVRTPDGVILEAGFSDARSLLRSSPLLALLAPFSTYRFPAADFVQRAAVPALVIHGDRDRVVPFELGRALYERIAGPKQFFVVAGGYHNDPEPTDPRAYWDAVAQFVATLGR